MMTPDATELDWQQGEAYKVEAHYPNSTVEPYVAYWLHWRAGRKHALELSEVGVYTTIVLLTPTRLALVQLWGLELEKLP